MGLFVDTVSADVSLPDLGIILTHPTTNFDLSSQFSPDAIRDSTSLTSAITGGQLNWKKTSGGSIEPNADYDPDFLDVQLENTGTGNQDDRAVTFKDLTAQNLTGVSPGYNFGYAGNANSGTWLRRVGGVPSNRVGIPIFLDNGKLIRVTADNESSTSYEVEIYEHSGDLTNSTLLTTLTVSGSTDGLIEGLDVSVTKGKQLAAKVSSGSGKNMGVTCSLKGDSN